MININNSVKGVFFNSGLPVKKISFKANREDVFVKTSENDNQKELENKETTMAESKLYKSDDIDDKKNQMIKDFKSRIIAFPFVLKSVMALVPSYMEQILDADDFSQGFLERTPNLFARIDFGEDKEDFSKDFEHEIKMVKNLNVTCSEYVNGEIQQEKLDNTLDQNVKAYLETPENNDVFYLE